MPQNPNNLTNWHPPNGKEDIGNAQDRSPRSFAGSSFAARFGRVILKHGVAAIPSALYHFQGRLGLSAQQVWFTSYILSHKWDEDLPYPSIAQMARSTGISDRMLRYRCNELHHLGYLQIYPRYGEDGGQSSNYYDFGNLFARLEEIISEEAPRPNPIQEGNGDRPSAPATPAQADSSFLARYGRVILSYGIAAVPQALFTHQKALGLTAQQVWFTCYVLSFQWDTALPYPSINKMAERTGYSKQQLHTIKGELVAKGYLQIERRLAEGGGNDTNLYDFSSLFDAIRVQLEPSPADTSSEQEASDDEPEAALPDEATEPDTPPAKRKHRPSQPKHARITPPNTAGSTKPAGAAIGLTTWAATQLTTPTATELSRGSAMQFTRGAETQLSTIDNHTSGGSLNHALPTGRKPALPEVEPLKAEEINQDDSNRHSQKNRLETERTHTTNQPYSPYIAAIAADFSRELGDSLHEASNMKQAINLWQSSGLQEQRFVELMQEARKLTRKYQSRPTWDALNNKMAYLFTTLRDLITQAADG